MQRRGFIFQERPDYLRAAAGRSRIPSRQVSAVLVMIPVISPPPVFAQPIDNPPMPAQ